MTRRIEWLHDGRIAQGPPLSYQAYTADELQTMFTLDYINVHMRHFFLPTVQDNLQYLRAALRLREQHGVKLMLYVNMLHVPRVMDTTEGTWDHLWASLHSKAITTHCAWRAQHGGPDLYWCDPTLVDSRDVADFILDHISRAQVAPDAIFLDHAIEQPWLYDERRPLTADEFPVAAFRSWQHMLVFDLRWRGRSTLAEGREVWLNGSWALDDHERWKLSGVTGKQWENLGARWSRWANMSLAKIAQWNDSSLQQILDVRGHPAYTAQGAIARFMAATRSHILIRKGNLT